MGLPQVQAACCFAFPCAPVQHIQHNASTGGQEEHALWARLRYHAGVGRCLKHAGWPASLSL